MEKARETLNKSFDKLRTNGKLLIPFVVSRELVERSNHERNQLVQRFPSLFKREDRKDAKDAKHSVDMNFFALFASLRPLR